MDLQRVIASAFWNNSTHCCGTLKEIVTMSVSNKVVVIGGKNISIQGSDNDRYFQNIEAFATETNPLYRFVQRYVRSGGVVLDVGGNIGLTSIAMSGASPSSQIVAFEPSPVNAEFFRKNTADNSNIELVNAGVANESGFLNFVIPPDGANAHVATQDYQYHGHPDFHPTSVPVITLDEFSRGRRFSDPVTLIKIDVEGFEPNVLAGAAELIAKDAPWLWVEFNAVALNVAHGYSPMAFASRLFERFEVMAVDSGGKLTNIADPGTLVHNNMVLNRSIEDVVLKPRSGHRMPSVEEFVLPRSACEALTALRAMKLVSST
jgi:FkbM family methyltransferase